MVIIKNSQRTIAVNTKELELYVQKILHIVDYSDFDIGLWITTNKTIRTFNKEYRHKDTPTDILSFSYHSHLKAGERINPKTAEDYTLGDLIISAEYVQKAAKSLGVPFQERLQYLIVHGICHLLGYDHVHDADYKKMHALEKAILKKLG